MTPLWPPSVRGGTSALLALLTAWICGWMVLLDTNRQSLQAERTELRHIRHGLLDVNAWKTVVGGILAEEIDRIDIPPETRAEVQAALEKALAAAAQEGARSLLDEVRARLPAPVIAITGIDAALQRTSEAIMASRAFKTGASTLSEEAMRLLESRLKSDTLKGDLRARLDAASDGTHAKVDRARRDAVLKRHGTSDPAIALSRIELELQSLRTLQSFAYGVIGVCMAVIVALTMRGTQAASPGSVLSLASTATALLASALYLPMMTIEATISRLAFSLAGQEIAFHGQVLFHQSKSILDIAWIMLKTLEIGPMLVATLVWAFSIALPLAKIVATVVVVLRGVFPQSRMMTFLVHESGKWSMADVLVVAIFMAYIGFNGVIDYQLSELSSLHPDVDVQTRNDTGFEAGFYLFVAYCVSGILLGSVTKRESSR